MAERQFFLLSAPSSHAEPHWQPAVDVYRHQQGWLIKCELAGVHPDDIKVSVEESRLTITGVRRDWTIVEGQRAYSLEIAYNRFARQIELPGDLMHASLDIDYREGMLLIQISTHPESAHTLEAK